MHLLYKDGLYYKPCLQIVFFLSYKNKYTEKVNIPIPLHTYDFIVFYLSLPYFRYI